MACTGGNHVDQYGRVLKYHVLEPCARELLGVRKGRSVAMLCNQEGRQFGNARLFAQSVFLAICILASFLAPGARS